MDPHDHHRLSHDDLLAEVERLRREVIHLEAAAAARKRVKTQLERERDAYRAVFDECPIIQVWIDREGRVLRGNKVAQALVGMESSPREFTIMNDPQLIMLGVPEYFARALAGETVRMPRYVFNTSKTHATGRDLDLVLETVLHPVFGEDGAVHSVVVQHFDVSALDAAQREVARLAGHPCPER